MLSKQQMLNHDYDWYCVINDRPVCVASNGGFIPDVINISNNVINTQTRAQNLPRRHHFSLNTNYIVNNIVNTGFDYVNDVNSPYRERFRPQNINFQRGTPIEVCYYCEYFAKMAERGFYVFDRLQESDLYSLIAWPDFFNMDLLTNRIYRDLDNLTFEFNEMNFNEPESLIDIDLVRKIDSLVNR